MKGLLWAEVVASSYPADFVVERAFVGRFFALAQAIRCFPRARGANLQKGAGLTVPAGNAFWLWRRTIRPFPANSFLRLDLVHIAWSACLRMLRRTS